MPGCGAIPRGLRFVIADPAPRPKGAARVGQQYRRVELSLETLTNATRTPRQPDGWLGGLADSFVYYLVILVTRPAPTVRPPSRMAKRSPSSMAIGWMSSTAISVLSPGMTISVPSGSVTTPVTSVVRK